MVRPTISLKARALRYLSAREHSRMELTRKLSRYAQESDNIEQLLDTLEAAKLLSEARFCDSLINRRKRQFGNSRIMAELQSHGVASITLVEAKATLRDGEVSRACEVWQRKFGMTTLKGEKEGEKAAGAAFRAKQMRFLQQRGFSHQAIRAAMAAGADNSATEWSSASDGRNDSGVSHYADDDMALQDNFE
jgi:regulatory protein